MIVVPCPAIEIVFLFIISVCSAQNLQYCCRESKKEVLILLKAFGHKKVARPKTSYNIIDLQQCSEKQSQSLIFILQSYFH